MRVCRMTSCWFWNLVVDVKRRRFTKIETLRLGDFSRNQQREIVVRYAFLLVNQQAIAVLTFLIRCRLN
ncbi:hypothetical protein F511_25122 [Dorcoceras hygrometricum]|uniref:Uncharacterized protein n=2 Tax=Dorcoceras hygrometricum TaxID=472368 RepID=A0A2Z7CEJ1_9LAMI|nr:hypothetical protein F511_07455 [Dorcoceras hygrometricum]KZV56149.1 hypothetical protein F511_25122 [Dorcoceras hygrometricum]